MFQVCSKRWKKIHLMEQIVTTWLQHSIFLNFTKRAGNKNSSLTWCLTYKTNTNKQFLLPEGNAYWMKKHRWCLYNLWRNTVYMRLNQESGQNIKTMLSFNFTNHPSSKKKTAGQNSQFSIWENSFPRCWAVIVTKQWPDQRRCAKIKNQNCLIPNFT